MRIACVPRSSGGVVRPVSITGIEASPERASDSSAPGVVGIWVSNSWLLILEKTMAQMQRPSNLVWRKSTFSEVWRKSTFSEAGGCVEIACAGQVVLARDSKDHSGPIQEIPIRWWQIFMEQVKAGRFDCDGF